MAKSGRKNTPDYLKVVEGGPSSSEYDDGRCGYPTADGSPCRNHAGDDGRCHLDAHTGSVDRRSYPAPPHLGDYGRAFWQKYVDEAVRLGLLTQLDWSAFEKCAELYESARRAWDDWAEGDVTVVSSRGDHKKNPSWTVYNQAAKQYRMYLSELGFTPTARSGLDLSDEEEFDPLSQRMGS